MEEKNKFAPVGEMAQPVQLLAVKLDGLSLKPRSHMVVWEKWSLHIFCWFPHVHCNMCMNAHTKYINAYKKNNCLKEGGWGRRESGGVGGE